MIPKVTQIHCKQGSVTKKFWAMLETLGEGGIRTAEEREEYINKFQYKTFCNQVCNFMPKFRQYAPACIRS